MNIDWEFILIHDGGSDPIMYANFKVLNSDKNHRNIKKFQ